MSQPFAKLHQAKPEDMLPTICEESRRKRMIRLALVIAVLTVAVCWIATRDHQEPAKPTQKVRLISAYGRVVKGVTLYDPRGRYSGQVVEISSRRDGLGKLEPVVLVNNGSVSEWLSLQAVLDSYQVSRDDLGSH